MTVEELAVQTLGSLLWKNITQAAQITALQGDIAAARAEMSAAQSAISALKAEKAPEQAQGDISAGRGEMSEQVPVDPA